MIDKVNLEQAVSEINENASKNFKEALDVAVNLGLSLIHISEPTRPY